MFDYTPLFEALSQTPLKGWLETLPAEIEAALQPGQHGRFPQWLDALNNLPEVIPTTIDLKTGVRVGNGDEISSPLQAQIEHQLRRFHPWRKGPYHIYGLHIDTEWRSDWKWDRLAGQIRPLDGRLVLDVGCGNGYHCWRMRGAGARLVIGLDPFLLYVMQFQAIRHFIEPQPVYVLPLGIEKLPASLGCFDTIFSMGVLYHRRSPFGHLLALRDCLRPGGELVLETLVVDGEAGQVLVPEGRYARMRNVWFIPSCATLMSWLRRCRFQEIRLVDVTPTTTEEQRTTGWMTFQSLADFLHPDDPALTIEGHPAPKRAVVTAVAPL